MDMYYIGIDVGGTNIAVGITDRTGRIVRKGSTPTCKTKSAVEIIEDMAMYTLKIIQMAGLQMEDIKAVGIGFPGTVDSKTGIVKYANNINFTDVAISRVFQGFLNKPIFLGNDADCAALAESIAGAAKHAELSVTITLGTGIGGGIVANRSILAGASGMTSEIGHMVIQTDGVLCTCGRRGCWEAYASASALIYQTREIVQHYPGSKIEELVSGDLNQITAETPFRAAREGDQLANSIIAQYVRYLGVGLANIINILVPDRVIIGGGICAQGDFLLNPLRELVKQNVYSGEQFRCDIRKAELGNDAGIIGAAMLGQNL